MASTSWSTIIGCCLVRSTSHKCTMARFVYCANENLKYSPLDLVNVGRVPLKRFRVRNAFF